MSRKGLIDRSALSDIIGGEKRGKRSGSVRGRPRKGRGGVSEGKEKFSTMVGSGTLERARAAVYYTASLTMSDFVEEALRREVARLEKQRGEKFPEYGSRLRAGRPLK